VFLTCGALYLLNRFWWKPDLELFRHTTLFAWYLNDILCIPFCLPPLLYLYGILRFRKPTAYPTRFEVLTHLVVWSLFFEWLAPFYLHRIFPNTVSDPWDVVAYAVGAAIAGCAWGTWSQTKAIRNPIRATAKLSGNEATAPK